MSADQDTPTSPAPDDQSQPDFFVVGIGASAGGLESLEKLFSNLPADSGMAFVVLQHLSPDFKSLMDELLARRTTMRIRQAEHNLPIEPNTVYLLPPMKEMIIRQRTLLLNDKDPRHGLTLPIDLFFRSLAQDVGERAVAVVLSGSGSDGSRGIQEISRAGGMVICESPDTAQFNGMPLSAIRTGVVDHVLAPEEIAMTVAAVARPNLQMAGDGAVSDEDRGVDAVLRLLREEFGIDFSHYKTSTVSRRIERRLALNRSLDIEMYIEQLRSDPGELSSLYEDLLIGVTRFFRDDAAFDALEQRIIPELVERTAAEDQVRVWVPGCATGQEAYSIAMLLHERLAAKGRPFNVKILATDVHKASLEVASVGLYSEEQLAGVTHERLQRFFTPKPSGFQVTQQLRDSIVFASHNLIRDAPFTKLDLISCRNLLIYFQSHAQKTVLALFHFALKPGGFLFLGSSESPGGLVDEFDSLDEHAKVYRKRRDIGLPRDLKLPLPRSSAAARMAVAPATRPSTAVNQQQLAIYDKLLDRFMPPSFLVDEHGILVDTFGGAESFLRLKGRRPSQQLLDLVDDELRPVLGGLLHRVRRDVESVRYPGVPMPGKNSRFSLVAEPIRDAHGVLLNILLSLADSGATAAPALVPPFVDVPAPAGGTESHRLAPEMTGLSREHVQALEDELSYTKEHLQTALQEHETANEELQATNEELIAANEELQELNNDIEHLLNGTDLATMFLDRQLCIRKFTPRIAETFRVIPQDVGRPLRSFTHDLLQPSLLADVEAVLRDGGVIESQTFDRRGRCFFLRILPYHARSREQLTAPVLNTPPEPGAPDGVVITLTDISPLEQARARLAQLSAIVESSDDAIIGKSLDGIINTWNGGAERLYGYTTAQALGRHASFLYPPGRKDEIDMVLSRVRDGGAVERLETKRLRKDGTLVDVSVTYSPILNGDAVVGVSAISRDIGQLLKAQQEIADREERIRLLLDSTAEAIYGIDLSGVCIFCNSACARLTGHESPSALIGRQMHPLIHHSRPDGSPNAPEQSPLYQAMRNREGAHVTDEVIWRADGTSFPAEYWSHPIMRNGEVIGAVVTFLDVTERRHAEREIQEGVQRREQFLAMLSHELRNPLAAILSATRVLARNTWTDDACQEAGEVISRQANHMARLLDDLLDVARITRGRIELRRQLIDLRDSARSAIEALGPLLAERGTHLEIDISDEPILLMGDPVRLQQVQANLLSNAAKYSPVGGHVHFSLHRDGDNAVLRVMDDGCGIDGEMLPKIFDLFVQGQQSIDRSQGGLGIGLTLLRTLVELHGGTVEARSDGHGKGSTFTVWLPLAPVPAPVATSNDREPAPASVRTVVVVEDQADARRMLQILLEAQGIHVDTAENGAEGAELIERLQPDLALVDLGLPVMSGFELARRVRSNTNNARTKLVALSGYGQDGDVQAALEAGFDEHLTKPPDPGRLEELLRGR